MRNNHSIGILVLACASFLGLGIVSAAIGPALPELAGNTASPLSMMGSIFTGMFFGTLLAQSFTGVLLDRLGPRRLMPGGLLVVGTGMLGVAQAHALPLALGCAAFAGLGYGIIAVVLNVSMGDLFPHKRASVLNLVNVFFGVGAFIAPAVAGLSLRATGSSLPALRLGAAIELLLFPLFLWLFHVPAAQPAAQPAGNSRRLLGSPVLWLLALLLLLYVGTEGGAGGWVSTYLQQTTSLQAATAALGASGFWMALTLGRMAATLLGARWPARTLLSASLATALLGGLLIVASIGSIPASMLGFVLLGFGFGPVFPTTMAIATATFRDSPGAAGSLLMAMGSIGGMLIPWLQGIVLEVSGPRAGVLIFPLSGVLMLACLAAIRRAKQVRPAKPVAMENSIPPLKED